METRAWITLLVLSALTAAMAMAQSILPGWAIPAWSSGLLVLAWLKARLILAYYLGLAAAPEWLRGFNLVLALYAISLLALTLAG